MQVEQSKISIHGCSINYYHWHNHFEAPAVVCVVHGLGEHAMRYDPVIRKMGDHHIRGFAYDRRGHGLSEGKRGHSESWDALMAEIDQMLELAVATYPKAKLILYGHSMGGNLTLNYILENRKPIDGAIVTSPWIKTSADPPVFLVNAIHKLASFLPKFSTPNGLKVDHMSRNPEEVEKYRNDPLVHNRISLNLASIMFKAVARLERSHQSDVPILLMHGSGDRICLPTSSKRFADQFSGDLLYKVWPEYFHEIHNDFGKDAVINEMIRWINKL